jgi:hypothetical protein
MSTAPDHLFYERIRNPAADGLKYPPRRDLTYDADNVNNPIHFDYEVKRV